MPSHPIRLLALASLALAPALPAQTAVKSTTLFAYDRTLPLNVSDSLVRTDEGTEIRHIAFDSPKGGRATGYLLVPPATTRAKDGRYAGIVLLHGAPGDAAKSVSRAAYYARHGAVVLALDAPFARRNPNEPVAVTVQDSTDDVQLIVDLQRAVDLLLARADVDPARLAYVGGSYGGARGALLAGIEHRIGSYVLATADGGLTMHFTDANGDPFPAPDGIADSTWRAWLRTMAPIGSIEFVGNARPGSVLYEFGEKDAIVPPRNAKAMIERTPGATVKWYDSGHALPAAATRDALAWLSGRIGLTPPTADDETIRQLAPVQSSSGIAVEQPPAPRTP